MLHHQKKELIYSTLNNPKLNSNHKKVLYLLGKKR